MPKKNKKHKNLLALIQIKSEKAWNIPKNLDLANLNLPYMTKISRRKINKKRSKCSLQTSPISDYLQKKAKMQLVKERLLN